MVWSSQLLYMVHGLYICVFSLSLMMASNSNIQMCMPRAGKNWTFRGTLAVMCNSIREYNPNHLMAQSCHGPTNQPRQPEKPIERLRDRRGLGQKSGKVPPPKKKSRLLRRFIQMHPGRGFKRPVQKGTSLPFAVRRFWCVLVGFWAREGMSDPGLILGHPRSHPQSRRSKEGGLLAY